MDRINTVAASLGEDGLKGHGVLLQTCLEWNMVKIEKKRRMVEKAGTRNENKMCQRSGRTRGKKK